MPANIQNIVSSLTKDYARPSRFDVQIALPIKLAQYIGVARNARYRCEASQLPGVSMGTVNRKIYGPIEKQPLSTNYNDALLIFAVSGDLSEKYLFDAWINLIQPNSSFDLNYKSDYVAPLTINQYDVTDKLVYSVTLNDCFPYSINQLDLDWSNETMFHKLYVTFAYHTWTQNTIQSFEQNLIQAGISTGVNLVTDALRNISGQNNGSGIDSSNPYSFTYSMSNIASVIGN